MPNFSFIAARFIANRYRQSIQLGNAVLVEPTFHKQLGNQKLVAVDVTGKLSGTGKFISLQIT